MNPTGVIWARVSTADQLSGYSPDGQIEEMRKVAAEFKVDVSIREPYRVGESGKRSEQRRAFREMIEYVRGDKVPFIIVWKIDRVGRNYKDLYLIQRMIDEEGLKVLVATDRRIYSKQSPPQDRFVFRMMGDIAQLESETNAERTRLGMTTKRGRGEITWAAPIGYRNVPDPKDPDGRRKTVAVDDERAEFVKKAFELYASGGFTISSLTDELNRIGMTTKQGHKVSRRCVEEILKNHFYIGEFWDKGRGLWVTHPYPRLVSAKLFQTVAANLKAALRNSKGRHDAEYGLFFKPFLRCGYCGRRLTGMLKKGRLRYYSCCGAMTTKAGRKLCPDSQYYREETIDRLLTEAVGSLYVNDVLASRLREHLRTAHDRSEAPRRRELARLQRAETRLTHKLGLLYDDRLNDVITVDEYKAKRSPIAAELASVKRRITDLGETNAAAEEEGSTILELLKGFREAYLRADTEGKARILNVVLDHVELKGKDGADSKFTFRPPFNLMFEIGEYVRKASCSKNGEWGE